MTNDEFSGVRQKQPNDSLLMDRASFLPTGTLPVLLRSRVVLPYRAIRKHLGAVGNENAFAFIVQARTSPPLADRFIFRGGPHRLQPGTSPHALRIPPHDGHPALRRIAPPADDVFSAVFGYSAPHLSARGTSTLLSDALLSA